MAGNHPGGGNARAGALLRSANARAISLENLNDEQAAYDYARSGYTDEAYAAYADYLNQRINRVNGRGDLTSAAKALSLTKNLDSASKSNLSAQITRENIQMLTGNASTSDKLSLVVHQSEIAKSLGDLTLYQHLEEQAYSLSQQVQKEQADAAVASQTLARVNSTLNRLGIGSGKGDLSYSGGGGNNADWVKQIRAAATKYGVDPQAALAVASAEGLSGGVGDNGTSFGPFQLHVGGALPAGKDRAWAESAAGIDYAMSRIATVARGKTGQAAVSAIVTGFERPANPSGEIQRAMAAYGGNIISGGPLSAAQARVASGNYSFLDSADASVDEIKGLQQGYVSAAASLQTKLAQFNQDFAQIGTKGQAKAIDNWVKDVAPALKQLGIDLPVGAKPNYGDLLQGVYLGLNKIYQNASIAAGAFDQAKADDYANKANGYATGQTKIPTLVKGVKGGSLDMNLADLKELAYSLANPVGSSLATTARFMAEGSGGIVEKPQAGLRYTTDLGGGQGPGIAANYLPQPFAPANSKENYQAAGQSKDDPNAYQSAPLDLTKSLQALHLQYRGKSAGQGDLAVVSSNSPGYIKKIAKPGTTLQIWLSPTGLQFAAAPGDHQGRTVTTEGNSVYTVARDGAGKQGLYEEGPNGSIFVGGDNGYNLRNPGGQAHTGEAKGFLDKLGSLLASPLHNFSFASMFGQGASGVVASASLKAYQIQQAQIAEANRQAALALLNQPARPCPTSPSTGHRPRRRSSPTGRRP
jgi:hypothetical protein